MVIGGGVAGQRAAEVAVGMGAETYVYDRSSDRLRELAGLLNGRASTRFASTLAIEEQLPHVDLVIGAVLIRGAKSPRVLTREHLTLMRPGTVLVDVSIDQGGCFETSRATTHADPTYELNGVIHYCMTNVPGAVPISSTYALTNATLPYVARLAERGVRALLDAPGFLAGLNVCAGQVTSVPVAEAQGLSSVHRERSWTALIP
jgi:alanine dehydrogenase